MAYPLSYWEKDALHKPVDFIIIGAGITGLCAALRFKEKFPLRRVLVFERGLYPAGATTRNAGFACFGSIGELLDDLSHEPEDAVFSRFEKRYRGLQRLMSIIGQHDIGYEACGNAEVFDNQRSFEKAADEMRRFNEWAKTVSSEKDVFTPAIIAGKFAIRNRLEGVLHSGKLAKTLLSLCFEKGVEIRFNTLVTKLEEGCVHAGGLVFEGSQVLVATNGFTSTLIPDLPIKPARGWIMVTEPIPGGHPWKGGFHYDRGYVYFRHIGDRLLLGGARHIDKSTEETLVFGENPAIKQWLETFADTYLGLAGKWRPESTWSGIMGFSDAKSPMIRRVNPSTVVAAGLGGIGIAIGALVADEAIAMVESALL